MLENGTGRSPNNVTQNPCSGANSSNFPWTHHLRLLDPCSLTCLKSGLTPWRILKTQIIPMQPILHRMFWVTMLWQNDWGQHIILYKGFWFYLSWGNFDFKIKMLRVFFSDPTVYGPPWSELIFIIKLNKYIFKINSQQFVI